MQFLEFCGGPRPHRRYAHAPDVAQVVKGLEEIIEKCAHAVRTGEDDPVVSIEPEDGVDEVLFFVGWHNLDGRDFEHFCPEFEQLARKLAGLLARACDDNALAKERAPFEPVELIAQI